jgi:hypothetical protein
MTKVKTFVTNSYNPAHHDRLDNSINKFLEENDVEVVDIKYSTSCCADTMGRFQWIPTAMLIYKVK